jgi:hypothetical protein
VGFILVSWTGVFSGRLMAGTIVVVALGASYILLLDSERFKGWARGEGGWIGRWFG